jgi:hypothetical protein
MIRASLITLSLFVALVGSYNLGSTYKVSRRLPLYASQPEFEGPNIADGDDRMPYSRHRGKLYGNRDYKSNRKGNRKSPSKKSMNDGNDRSGVIFSSDFQYLSNKGKGKHNISNRDRRRERMLTFRERRKSPVEWQKAVLQNATEAEILNTEAFSSLSREEGEERNENENDELQQQLILTGNEKKYPASSYPSSRTQSRDYKTSRDSKHISRDRDDRRVYAPKLPRGGLRKSSFFNSDIYCREVTYDHLASHPMNAIYCPPRIPKSKNVQYVNKWWLSAKKWNILSEDLLNIESSLISDIRKENEENQRDLMDNATKEGISQDAAKRFSEAVWVHCAEYNARIIVVGDVHGCVQELQDLLLKVKVKPCDVVILLGDLVAKGPRSHDVIQMAMDIGALSVRGNHDQEVIRRATSKSIINVRSQKDNSRGGPGSSPGGKNRKALNEHVRIASELTPVQWDWMQKLPYFLKSDDLGALFVHAGFQSDADLSDQDPWVMMTMRSMLPGQRPSARCDYRYPWAARWQGPMTVYFGHDAARGLQRYDHAVGLDTGCVYGGELTGMILPDKEFVAVRARQVYQDMKKSRSHKSLSATQFTPNGSSKPPDFKGGNQKSWEHQRESNNSEHENTKSQGLLK